MNRGVVMAAALLVLVSGCSSSDEPKAGDEPTPTASEQPVPEPKPTPTPQPLPPSDEGISGDVKLPDEGKEVPGATFGGWREVPWQRAFEPCYPERVSFTTDAKRKGSRTLTLSGPLAQVEQVEVYSSAKVATAALKELRDALDRCDESVVQGSVLRRWVVEETGASLEDADESFFAASWYVQEGTTAPPGGPFVVVLRAGAAVYLHTIDGQTNFGDDKERAKAAATYGDAAAEFLPTLAELG